MVVVVGVLGYETRSGLVTRIGARARVSMRQDPKHEQLVHQDPRQNITHRKQVFPKRFMQPLVGCEDNRQQGCVTVGLSTIGADRWQRAVRRRWLGRNRCEYSLPDIEPLPEWTLGMVMWPGRQGEGGRVGEDQVIDIRILYK